MLKQGNHYYYYTLLLLLPLLLAPFFNRIKMWRKFKGHAVFGAGGVIGPRGKLIEVKPQGKKGIDGASSVVRATPLGQGFPRPGMPMPMPMHMPGMPGMPGMNPGMPGMPGMNPYMMQQPPRGPYGAPPPR